MKKGKDNEGVYIYIYFLKYLLFSNIFVIYL